MIHPEGFDLLTDGPKHRRAFIDWGVFHVEPAFFDAWGRFKRLNKQRNALLKTASISIASFRIGIKKWLA